MSETMVERMARASDECALRERYVQGFHYGGKSHVIRDVWLRPEHDELWRLDTDDYEAGHSAMMAEIARIKSHRRSLAALKAMLPFSDDALTAAATVEAEWDGRTFAVLGRADKQRYKDRLAAASAAMIDAAIHEAENATK